MLGAGQAGIRPGRLGPDRDDLPDRGQGRQGVAPVRVEAGGVPRQLPRGGRPRRVSQGAPMVPRQPDEAQDRQGYARLPDPMAGKEQNSGRNGRPPSTATRRSRRTVPGRSWPASGPRTSEIARRQAEAAKGRPSRRMRDRGKEAASGRDPPSAPQPQCRAQRPGQYVRDNRIVDDVCTSSAPGDFYADSHQRVFAAILPFTATASPPTW